MKAKGRTYLNRFKNPLVSTIFCHLVPPPQAHKYTPCDVLHSPKVESDKDDDYDEGDDESFCKEDKEEDETEQG